MGQLVCTPALLADYGRDPAAGLKNSGLSEEEKTALKTGREINVWQLLLGRGAEEAADATPAEIVAPRPGQLAVVGTGIRSVGQLTVEAIAWMRQADALVYLVADPISEEIIRSLNPTAISLQGYYGEGAGRMGSYEAMVEHILSCVRSGKRTCAAFYGHPGVFAFPSHESIRRARSEGYIAF